MISFDFKPLTTKSVNKINGGKVKRYFFLLILILFCLPVSLVYTMTANLDASWMLGIHMAIEKGLVFGDDILFTYGPLGFLAIRMPFAVSVYSYIIFDFYTLFSLFLAFNYILKKRNNLLAFIIILLITILCSDFRDHDIVVVLTWILLTMILAFSETKNVFFLVNAAIISILVFYVKVNFGIITVASFIIFLVYFAISMPNNLRLIGIFSICYTVVFIIVSFFLNVSWWNYFVGSLHLINSFNDAMYEPLYNELSNPHFLSAIFIFLLLPIFGLIYFKKIIRNPFALLFFLIVLLFTYVLFKQGYTRLHTESYFQFVTAFLGLIAISNERGMGKTANTVVLTSLFVCYLNQGGVSILFDANIFNDKIERGMNYYTQVKSYDSIKVKQELLDQKMKPQMTSIIDGSIDIQPFDISFLYINELDYNPRPIIQTYSAYDAFLDKKNAAKYFSDSAPNFIMTKLATIDDRYALFDETHTKLAQLQNYDVTGELWEHVLLEKSNNPIEIGVVNEVKERGSINEYIELEKSDEIQILEVNVNYSLMGKLRRVLFQPPQLFITLISENGVIRSHRAVTTILKGGVIINKYMPPLASKEEYKLFYSFNGEVNENIVGFVLNTPQEWGFENDFTYSIKKLNFNGEKRSQKTYQNIEEIIPSPTGDVSFNIENFQTTRHYTILNGWAFPQGFNSNNSNIQIVLRSDKKSYVFPTSKVYRSDVSSYFMDSLDGSGFSAAILNRYIDSGTYDVGLLIRKLGRSFLHYSNKKIKYPNETSWPVRNDLWSELESEYFIDTLKIGPNAFEISGWAYLKNFNNNISKISIVLTSESNTLVFPIEPVERLDLNPFFHRPDLQKSGFRAFVQTNYISTGDYNLWLLIENNGTNSIVRTKEKILIR